MAHTNLTISRELAYDAFVIVLNERKRARAVLEQLLQQKPYKGKHIDREFVKDVLFGSLRWYSKLYWILQNTSKRNLDDVSPEIRAALVCGTFQIYYMEKVPDRIAVNESVEYIRQRGQANAVSFVNGILRQIARRAEYFQKPDKETKQVEYLSLQFAHPDWMVRRWTKYFKMERMETMLSFNNQKPPFTVRCNVLKTEVQEIKTLQQQLLKQERTHTEKRPLRTALILKEEPQVGPDSLYQQGFYSFHDEASQLVGLLVAAAEGQQILHANAGKGKRSTHLDELAKGTATITALVQAESDGEFCRRECQRLGCQNVHVAQGHLLEWKTDQRFDRILLTPPNSELGRLRRIPEQKQHFTEAMLREMVEEQGKMLERALRLLKPEGELIYSVDSFEKEEVEQHLERLMQKYEGNIEQISPVPRLPDYYKKYVTRQNTLLIFPGNQDEMDGLGAFIVKLKKPIED